MEGGKKRKKMKISIRRRYITITQTAGEREMPPRQKASLPGICPAFARKVSVSGRGGERRGALGFPSPGRFTFGGTVTFKSSKLWPAPS